MHGLRKQWKPLISQPHTILANDRGDGGPLGRAHRLWRVISTRRFFCRPSGSSLPLGLVFGATGLVSPKPCTVSGFEAPCATSHTFTESARRSESFLFPREARRRST